VLQRRSRLPRIVEPEDGRAGAQPCKLAELGVVAVDDEIRLVGQGGDGRAPPLRDELELAVPVELVAEEIAQADRARMHARGDLRQRTLVHLEEPELRVAGREQGGGHPRDEVRSRSVVGQPVARTEDLGSHRGGRRLPVRRRDEHRAGR
jgi:hypothetical protein